ncbi:MAG: hypothetical protein CSB13_09180 [Chloroflexi bacterium]|nr:MAG: hypothetical protein CSB13_09180 [Chloroflexota bacterium]
MIRDLDATLEQLLTTRASAGSELASADISFEIPDETWRNSLSALTVNCYLYDIHENLDLRNYEPLIQRSNSGSAAVHRQQPRRINCAYCITAWSTASGDPVFEEHRVLSQILRVLLRNPTVPPGVLQGSLVNQIPPYPTVAASPDGIKNNPEFWGALDQQLKPSLSYILTIAMMMDDEPDELTPVVEEVRVIERAMEEFESE